jgi:two-component system, LuxR family, response regulator FixJ
MQAEELQLKKPDETSCDKKQIYILDDDESVLRSLKLLMVSYGFKVNTFSSAEEFFNNVQNNALGCLILDIHMPGINGWDTQQRLTKTGYNLPVIVITADKDDRFKEKALKAGAVGFLQKPFEDHYLLHMVNQLFNKRRTI